LTAENKLTVVTDTNTSLVQATFTYDGDGTLVKKVADGVTTLYAGGIYEKQSQDTDGVIGEVGQITDLTHITQTIELAHTFRNPVVFMQPPSYNESDQTVVRILDVQADSFTVVLHDAPNKTPSHTTETVSYIVLEEGQWELPNEDLLEVGTVSTSATRSASPAAWESVSFISSFTATPVILSQVQTYNDPHWVKTRQHNASSTGFSVALEEDQVQTLPHGVERIGWLAIEPSRGEWGIHNYEVYTTGVEVNSNWYTQNFSPSLFTEPPRFVGTITTYIGWDTAYLRYQNLVSGSVQIKIEEDTTYDSEVSHGKEDIAYLAIEGSGVLTGTMASPVVTKYYYFSGQRVAMRECVGASCDDPVYLHGDHLGSASLATDGDRELISDMRYYPYGATRSGTVGTDYRYTGQRAEPIAGGIYDYRARYYDSRLQWIQPDTIVPDFSNPQSLNRYAYALGNPLRYIDPTGHMSEWDWQNRWYNAHGFFWDPATGFWSTVGNPLFADVDIAREIIGEAGITLGGDASWTDDNIKHVAFGVAKFGQKLGRGTSGIKSLTGGGVRVNLEKKTTMGDACWAPPSPFLSNGRVVNLSVHMMNDTIEVGAQHFIHELGHVIDWQNNFSGAWRDTHDPLTDYAATAPNIPIIYRRKWEIWAEAVTVYVFGHYDANGSYVSDYYSNQVNARVTSHALTTQMSDMQAVLEGW
jgi:RHS repeat-associated protein